MPSGLTPRQEEFCCEAALDPSATRSAIRAGYAPANARSQASRLLAMPRIQARVAELRRDIAARHCADADSFMAKLEAVYRQAFEHGQFHAVVRAVELQMRLSGFLASGSGGPGGPTRPQSSPALSRSKSRHQCRPKTPL